VLFHWGDGRKEVTMDSDKLSKLTYLIVQDRVIE